MEIIWEDVWKRYVNILMIYGEYMEIIWRLFGIMYGARIEHRWTDMENVWEISGKYTEIDGNM